MNVIKKWLRSWIFVLLGWINNNHAETYATHVGGTDAQEIEDWGERLLNCSAKQEGQSKTVRTSDRTKKKIHSWDLQRCFATENGDKLRGEKLKPQRVQSVQAQVRRSGPEYALPVSIGDGVWLGGPSFAQASPSGPIRWWVPAAWSLGTCRRMWWLSAIPVASSGTYGV